LSKVTALKARNVAFSSAGTHPWGIIGAPTANAHIEAGPDGEPSYTIMDEESGEPPSVTQEAARAALEAGLAGMPHDKMVAALQHVVDSEFCDYYARHLAKFKLAKHKKGCAQCLK
jgi:hypothetical protein